MGNNKDMLLAHVIKNYENTEFKIHELKVHLEDVAKIAEQCAEPIGLQKLARIAGLAHDLGKASEAFQNKIASKSGYDPDAHVKNNVDHSTAGAQYLTEMYGILGTLLGYAVAGHHSGMPNGYGSNGSDLNIRMKKNIEEYKPRLHEIDFPILLKQDFFPKKYTGKNSRCISFLIRMIYSCLVDADFLDTESFMSPDNTKIRNIHIDSIASLQSKINNQIILKFKSDTPINKKRTNILRWCRDAAENPAGLFSLTVPTGGGKTISSMVFALDHAVKNKLRRIIYVIPYTSIITQNADVFRDIFGADNIVEHHSNLDPIKETALNRLSSQNWDAPIVVTTNIQFFESFYSNRSSSCRKLHNVADSVIIFDEAQMFPPEYLIPSIVIIKELVNNYGCSAVLCTATQPTLSDETILKKNSFQNVHEIIPDPIRLYNDFRRVQVNLLNDNQSNDDIAHRMTKHEQVLTIVNTRKDAKIIMQLLNQIQSNDETNYHLSTMMCPAHRRDILKTVKDRLEKKLTCRVVSTQLIEAGVDIDFPVVYRAISGIDSIAQAAGRCNRNGLLDIGEVFVFKGDSKPPIGHLRQSAESAERIFQKYERDPLSLEAIKEYFQKFYWKQNLDKKNIMQMIASRPDQIPFKDIAQAFKIIEDDTKSVIVPYGDTGMNFVGKLREWRKKLEFSRNDDMFVPRDMQKQSQQFSVQIRNKIFEEMVKNNTIEDIFGDGQYWILIDEYLYTDNVGLLQKI